MYFHMHENICMHTLRYIQISHSVKRRDFSLSRGVSVPSVMYRQTQPEEARLQCGLAVRVNVYDERLTQETRAV